MECSIGDGQVPGAKLLGAYVADLYLPGAETPFRQQEAGRELLDPSYRHAAALRRPVLMPGGVVCARDCNSGAGVNGDSDSVDLAPARRAPIIIVAEKARTPEAVPSLWARTRKTFLDWWNDRPGR